ncbi:hypothetical protein [Thalassobellus citreus]|uniref:hypothetical protein n=1 Tax=Thalassobellus citreus TaxID=3367752 RepID=UPI0037A80500
MGFFKKLFKKKKGGTFFGNLIRKASNVATGGILGNGEQLAKQDAKFEQQEYDRAVSQQQKQLSAKSIGNKLGQALKPTVDKALNSQTADDVNKAFTKAWFKKNMVKLIGGLVALIGTITLVMWLFKRKKKGTR